MTMRVLAVVVSLCMALLPGSSAAAVLRAPVRVQAAHSSAGIAPLSGAARAISAPAGLRSPSLGAGLGLPSQSALPGWTAPALQAAGIAVTPIQAQSRVSAVGRARGGIGSKPDEDAPSFRAGSPRAQQAVRENFAAPYQDLGQGTAGSEDIVTQAGEAFDGSQVQGRASPVAPAGYPAIADFMEAEQRLSEGNSIWTRPRDLLKRLIPHAGSYGALADEFKPSSRRTHRLTTLLIPEEDIPLMTLAEDVSENTKKVLFAERGGKRFVRFFILPTKENLRYYADEIRKYEADEREWLASPQSSARTLTTVTDSDGEFDPIVIKTSLDLDMGGGNRLIEDRDIVQAPIVNDLMREAQKDSESGWSYFPETAGVGGVGGKGGYLIREFPTEMLEGDALAIPLFALVNPTRGPPWLDTLAKNAGKDKRRFLAEDVVAPMVDAYSELSFGHGLIPEMHQQNALLLIDRETLTLKKIVLRDLNGFSVDVLLRRAQDLPDQRGLRASLRELRGARAAKAHHFNYKSFFRMESLKFLLGSEPIDGVRLRDLIRLADRRVLENANRLLGTDKFRKLSDLKRLTRIAVQRPSAGSFEMDADSAARQDELKRAFNRSVDLADALVEAPKRALRKASYVLRGKVLYAMDTAGRLLGAADAGKTGRAIFTPDTAGVKVSVILPVYNDIEDVDRAIRTTLAQTHENLEVFVVDDHSSDGVFEHVSRAYHDPRLHVIRLSKNAGLFALDNFILRNFVTGDFITWQDSDDYSDPARIKTQLRHGLRYGLDAVGIYWRSTQPDGSYKDFGKAYDNQRLATALRPPWESPFARSERNQLLSGGTKALYRTDAVLALGGFDGTQRFSQDSVFNSRFMRVFDTGAVTEDRPLYHWIRRPGSLTTSLRTGMLSWSRLRRRLITTLAETLRLDLLYLRGKLRSFVEGLVEELHYPDDLQVERYHGPGLPRGKGLTAAPGSQANKDALLEKLRRNAAAQDAWRAELQAAKSARSKLFWGPISLAALSAFWTVMTALRSLWK